MTKKMYLYFCVSFSCFLLFVGCMPKETVQPLDTIPEVKIAVLPYRRDDTFIAMLLSGLEETAKEYGQENNVKIILQTADGKGSQMVQNEQIDKFIEQGCDVLCVNLVDRTVAATVIDKAKAANIPIVFFNREPVAEDLERWNQVYYVGAEASESGILEGQIVVDTYQKDPQAMDKNGDGKLQYVVLEGEQGHQDALLRTKYAVKTITSAGIQMDKLAGDTANWHRSQAVTKMTQWIQSYGTDIELVLSNNDDMALGAMDAYALNNQPLPAIVGIDGTDAALQAMAEGKMIGTVKNDAKTQAKLIFELSYALALGEDVAKTMPLYKEKYLFAEYIPLLPETE